MKNKVLVCEDDPNLGEILTEYLEAKGFEVSLAINGEQGFQLFKNAPYDLCILDVMMPIKDGFSLANDIRFLDQKVPIIFLTAKSLKEDTLKGFQIGGDDYITKPFLMEELLLRIKAILKRTHSEDASEENHTFSIGLYTLNTLNRTLSIHDQTSSLTTKETALLKLFCENANQAVPRSHALKLIWGDDSYFNARSMDVYITKLRKHLKQDESIKILNLHGEGFKLIL